MSIDNDTERVLDTFRNRWHRLYLDTAELHDIADGRRDPQLLGDLFRALEIHAVILVVSIEHLRDALRPGDADAAKQLGDALEQFPLRGLVDVGPDAIEPWAHGPTDIKIDPWNNVREFLRAPSAEPALLTQAEVQDATFAGDVAANASMRTTGTLRVPRHLQPLFVGGTVSLMLGWQGDDVSSILDWASGEENLVLTPSEKDLLVQALQPVLEMVRHIGPQMDKHGTDRVAALRRVGLGPDRAPGFWLAGKLYENRLRNTTRRPTRSDSVDVFHASYYPYVDIATCDRQTYDALNRHISSARGTRTPSLYRNGRLHDVLEHVLRLPTGEDIARRIAEERG